MKVTREEFRELIRAGIWEVRYAYREDLMRVADTSPGCAVGMFGWRDNKALTLMCPATQAGIPLSVGSEASEFARAFDSAVADLAESRGTLVPQSLEVVT